MNLHKLSTSKSDEWHARRAEGIGGSEIGTIMGVNKWGCDRALYYSKLPGTPQQEETPAMRRGSLLENWILKQWSKVTTAEIGEYFSPSSSDQWPYCKGNPDGFALLPDVAPAVIEVKLMNPTRWNALREASDLMSDAAAFAQADELGVRMQAEWYAGLHGLEVCIVLACNSETLEIMELRWNAEPADEMFDAASGWWEFFIKGEQVPERLNDGDNRCFNCPHAQDCWADTSRTVGEGYDASDSPALEEAISSYMNATAKAKEAAAERKAAQEAIRGNMHGSDKVAHSCGVLLTVTHSTRKSIDAKTLKYLFPDVVDHVTRTTDVDTLRVK